MIQRLERARTVDGPNGEQWTVRRHLLPRGNQLQRRREARDEPAVGSARWFDGLDPTDLALFDGDAAWILLIVGVALVGFVVLAPLFILIVDIVVVFVGAIAGIIGRLLFRRPWRIEATRSGSGQTHSWGVVGTRESATAVDTIAEALADGRGVESITVGVAL